MLPEATLHGKLIETSEKTLAAILRAVVKLSPNGILIVDKHGRTLICNQRFVDLWEIPAHLLAVAENDEAILLVMPQLPRPEAFATRIKYINEHPDDISQDRLKIKNGTVLDCYSTPLHLQDGSYSGRVWYFHDITAEYQLREAQERLAAIVESSRDAIVTANLDGRMVTWNRAAEELFQLPAAEIIGRDMGDAEPPERAGEARRNFDTVRSTGLPVQYETVYVRKNGERIDLWIVMFPLKDAQGRVIAVSGTLRDITEKKTAEHALQGVARTQAMVILAGEEILRSTKLGDLYQNVCDAVVGVGGYCMAWVGLPENDPEKTLRPIARAGFEAHYLDTAKITWGGDALNATTAGLAIQIGMTQISRLNGQKPNLPHWRAEAKKRGYAACIALPLCEDSTVFGVFVIYAVDQEAFTAEEVKLLETFASNLAFGVIRLRQMATDQLGPARVR